MAKDQSTQSILITGKVVENNLKVGPSKTTGKIYATGDLLIETEPGNQVTIGVLQGQFKVDGSPNKLFNPIASLADEETGLKSVAKFGELDADVIAISGGQFVDSSFYADDGNLITHTKLRAPFFDRLKGEKAEKATPLSKFDVEVVINTVVEEIDREENFTGRLVVNAYVIAYNGEAIPVKLIAGHVGETATPEEKERAAKAVKYILASHEKGMTVKYSGSIISSTETRVVEEEVEFGDPIVNEYTSSKTEYRILSGTTPYEEERAFAPDAVTKGLAIRQESLEKAKERNQQSAPAANQNDAFGSSVDNSFGGSQLPQF